MKVEPNERMSGSPEKRPNVAGLRSVDRLQDDRLHMKISVFDLTAWQTAPRIVGLRGSLEYILFV